MIGTKHGTVDCVSAIASTVRLFDRHNNVIKYVTDI